MNSVYAQGSSMSGITIPQKNSRVSTLLIEGGDRVFVPIVLETATGDGNLALEVSDQYSSRKLLYTELLDVIIEEETIAQEEDFKMLMEEGTAGPGFTYIAENGTDTLKQIYEERFPGVPCQTMTSDESEFVKYFANCFFATKVSYFKVSNKVELYV